MKNNKNNNSEQYEYFDESLNDNKTALPMDENNYSNTAVSNTTNEKN